jgi:hypothetical protein
MIRTHGRMLIAFVAAGLSVAAAPSWGPASNGLALAVESDTLAGASRLRVHFRNESTAPIEFAIGGASGEGSMFSLDISTKDSDGRTCALLNTTVGHVAGFVSPIVIRLAPGETEFVSIELRKLICLMGRTTRTLDVLLEAGQSVQVSFQGKAESNAWANLRNGWTGTVASGTFQPKLRKQRLP